MSKIFNVNGDCKPDLHYMVNIESRLKKIKAMVDKGQYFTINRARQYGKTTTLKALEHFLEKDYVVVSLDFQMMSASKFANENSFSVSFAKYFIETIEECPHITSHLSQALQPLKTALKENKAEIELFELFKYLSNICNVSKKSVVLIIDEVDSATNNQVFLDFLAQLRAYYIKRDTKPTFQSVILAGVYDVKNIKRKIHSENDYKINSPWNIAADFLVDLSFSEYDIEGMLKDYEDDHQTGMDIKTIATAIYNYTSGYPFLVSRICQLMDERIARNKEFPEKSDAWTKKGFLEAIKLLLSEKNTLFESLIGKINEYPELKTVLSLLLFQGQSIIYNPDDSAIDIALMFGFVKVDKGTVIIANRIFETRLYNLFLTTSEVQNSDIPFEPSISFICNPPHYGVK